MVVAVAAAAAIAGTSEARADLVHHYRFEQGAFLEDSVGNADLTQSGNNQQVTLPFNDGTRMRGNNFPIPQGSMVNNSAANIQYASSNSQNQTLSALNTTAITGEFSVELYFNARSYAPQPGRFASYLVAQTSATSGSDFLASDSSWNLSIRQANVTPANQLRLSLSDGNNFFPFNFAGGTLSDPTKSTALLLNTDYYIRASFQPDDGLDANPTGTVTLAFQDLTNNGPLLTSTHMTNLEQIQSSETLQIGGIGGEPGLAADGLIDEVRITAVPEASQVLCFSLLAFGCLATRRHTFRGAN